MEPTDLQGTLLDVYKIEDEPVFYLLDRTVRVEGNADDNWTVTGKALGVFTVPLGHVEKHGEGVFVAVHTQTRRTPQDRLLLAIPGLLQGFNPRN